MTLPTRAGLALATALLVFALTAPRADAGRLQDPDSVWRNAR